MWKFITLIKQSGYLAGWSIENIGLVSPYLFYFFLGGGGGSMSHMKVALQVGAIFKMPNDPVHGWTKLQICFKHAHSRFLDG